MLHTLFPLPALHGEDIIQNQLRNLYHKNHVWLVDEIKSMLPNNNDKFSYNGLLYGSRYAMAYPLGERHYPQMERMLVQLGRWNTEYAKLRSFLLRMDLEDTYIRNVLPPLMGGNGDESDIPEIRLMYARILKNKLLE